MSPPSRSLRHPWLLVPLLAAALLIWLNVRRAEHVISVSTIGASDETTASGAAPHRNTMIVPGHVVESYHWILEAQQMIGSRQWRIRHVDYENAPFGRLVSNSSPYRWWLGALAWGCHLVSGRDTLACVERASLIADPLLQLMLLAGAGLYIARRFGLAAAGLFALGLAVLFPLSAVFLPGAPDEQGLLELVAIWSLLLLIAGLREPTGPADAERIRVRRNFLLGGIAAGTGLWINPLGVLPLLAGLFLSALFMVGLMRRQATASAQPGSVPAWRHWGLGAGATVLIAYLVEYFPGHIGEWQLRAIHPLYGLACVGVGELLEAMGAPGECGRPRWRWRRLPWLLLCGLAAAALPVAAWQLRHRMVFAVDPHVYQLTKLPDAPVHPTFGAWLRHDGISPAAMAVMLPFLLIGPAIWLAVARVGWRRQRMAVVLALGPVIVAIGMACRQLSWWNQAQAFLLMLMVVMTAGLAPAPRRARWSWLALVIFLLIPGAIEVLRQAHAISPTAPDRSDVFGLVDRDLADWLRARSAPGRATYVAPPEETAALTYYGAGRGVGSLSWENQAGLEASVRILAAFTPEEAKALMEKRKITHLILPSWDPYMDEYARMGMGQVEGTFLNRLHQWAVPDWLQPEAYQLPEIPGFEQQSVLIFRVVPEQTPAEAMSRTAEYFVELRDMAHAQLVAQGLRRYPADIGAWTARAEVETAQADQEALARTMKVLKAYITAKRDRTLPWDLRISLAVVLARDKQTDLAREQLKQCVSETDEAGLRSLSVGSLYRFLALSRLYGFDLPDPKLEALALDLLPSEARKRLQKAP